MKKSCTTSERKPPGEQEQRNSPILVLVVALADDAGFSSAGLVGLVGAVVGMLKHCVRLHLIS